MDTSGSVPIFQETPGQGSWIFPSGLCDFLLQQCWTVTGECSQLLQTLAGPSP